MIRYTSSMLSRLVLLGAVGCTSEAVDTTADAATIAQAPDLTDAGLLTPTELPMGQPWMRRRMCFQTQVFPSPMFRPVHPVR